MRHCLTKNIAFQTSDGSGTNTEDGSARVFLNPG
jgi:hypothetical protein